MNKEKPISTDEMVAAFLKAEVESPRWKTSILNLAQKYKISPSSLQVPDLTSEEENHIREQILSDFRGFNVNQALFATFPSDVAWWKVNLTKDELLNIKYMKYDYWDELSQGTRLASKAAETINQGIEVFEQSNQHFKDIANLFKQGKIFPELIVVATDQHADLVLLEGHARLTAMALAKEYIPSETEVIIGFSPQVKDWISY